VFKEEVIYKTPQNMLKIQYLLLLAQHVNRMNV